MLGSPQLPLMAPWPPPAAQMRCPSRGGAALWFPAPAPALLSLPAGLGLDSLRYVQCLQEMLSSSHEGLSPTAFEPVAQHVFGTLCAARLQRYDSSTFLQGVPRDPGCRAPGPYSSQPQGWGGGGGAWGELGFLQALCASLSRYSPGYREQSSWSKVGERG